MREDTTDCLNIQYVSGLSTWINRFPHHQTSRRQCPEKSVHIGQQVSRLSGTASIQKVRRSACGQCFYGKPLGNPLYTTLSFIARREINRVCTWMCGHRYWYNKTLIHVYIRYKKISYAQVYWGSRINKQLIEKCCYEVVATVWSRGGETVYFFFNIFKGLWTIFKCMRTTVSQNFFLLHQQSRQKNFHHCCSLSGSTILLLPLHSHPQLYLSTGCHSLISEDLFIFCCCFRRSRP